MPLGTQPNMGYRNGPQNTELHLEMLSDQIICCRYFLTLKSNISIGENSVGPVQTAPTLHGYSLSQGYKTYFMLNSAEHGISTAHKN